MTVSAEEAFRRLAMGETSVVEQTATGFRQEPIPWRLDGRTEALLRLGALVALDAPASSFRGAVEAAQRTGARFEDLLAVLAVLVGPVGSARVVSAAPKIALAAGYDVEAALE